MARQPTMRQNGKLMLTVQVAHDIFRGDLVHALAHRFDFVDTPECDHIKRPRTKQDVERFMEQELECSGRVSFEYPDNETPASIAWADQLVKDLYPDWTGSQ